MDAGSGLVLLNLVMGVAGAGILAHPAEGFPAVSRRRRFFLLLGVYLIESFAVSAGMASQIFTVGLAFVWGVVLGRRLHKVSTTQFKRQVVSFTVFTCLPSLSLLAIPVIASTGGWDIFSTKAGQEFGIPAFLHLPRPLGTILGFFAAVVIGSVALKTVLTLGVAKRFFPRANSQPAT